MNNSIDRNRLKKALLLHGFEWPKGFFNDYTIEGETWVGVAIILEILAGMKSK